MNQVADTMRFPETPEEMYGLLILEDEAKRDGGLTHRGMNGYLIRKLYERQLIMDRALYGYSVIDMSTGKRIDPRSIRPA